MKAESRIAQAFMTGEEMFWGEHDPDLFEATERFFLPGYAAHLVGNWIPSLEGVKEKFKRGAMLADVACGHGGSTIIMALGHPKSKFFGFDNHAPSINRAHRSAHEVGVADRVVFEIAGATNFPACSKYDLVAFFDCLHDFGDPLGAAKCAYETLAPDGTVRIVELMAGQTVLGTLAPEEQLRKVVMAGGSTPFRRTAETPFN